MIGHARPITETREHQATSRDLLARFLSALGMETRMRQVAEETGIPAGSLKRWCNADGSLPTKYRDTVEAWIEKRTGMRV